MQRSLAWPVLLLLLTTVEGSAQPANATTKKMRAAAVTAADTLDPVAPAIDHSAFDVLLRQHVAAGLVDYAAFRNNPEFAKYLASLNNVDPLKFEEPERIAFWLNVYNAYTIQLVASHGETQSIRNIDKTLGFFRLKGPWSNAFVKAAGKVLTLDDVEHRILRKEFSEPRVHFAMSFATIGGAPLRNEAYTGSKLDDQLEDQARKFIRESPKKNRVDTARYTVYASPILTKYREDFGATPSALGLFLAQYYPEGSPERKVLKPRPPRAVPPVATSNVDSAQKTPVTGAATNPAAKPMTKAESANRAPNPRVQNRQNFRIIETPFDWALNIQPSKR